MIAGFWRVDASDVVQETFVRASQNFESYLKSPNMHPVVWSSIGKHVVSETRRRHFRGKRTPDREHAWDSENVDLLVDKLADSIRSVATLVEHQELFQLVRSKLTLLSDHDREILEMRHVEGLSLEDAAASLELNLETAKKRYYRIRCCALRNWRAS